MHQISWGKTQKNKTLLIIDGHEFTHKLNTKTTTHWKCAKWRSHKCTMTVITCAKEVLSTKNEHNHQLNHGK